MVEQKSSRSPLALVLLVSVVFFVLFLIASGAMFLAKSPVGRLGDAIGVVEINGVIMDSKKTLSKLEKFEDNDQIKAVVVRLNSPGGSVAPSQEIYEAVRAYKKPIVVSMGSVAASGAYYVACGAKKVFANPGTMTGSIGVIMEFANLKKLYDWAKIQRYVVKSGKFKDIGAEFREMTPEEKVILQDTVNDILLQFRTAVVKGRKLSMDKVVALSDGRIFSGSQAKAAHLVDELGTVKDAIQEAAKLANIKGKPTVVYSDRQKRGLLDVILDDSSWNDNSESSTQWGGVLGQISRLLQSLDLGDRSNTKDFIPGFYWIWSGMGPR